METLTPVDLQNIISVIDTCSQRGAFKGPELKGVGELREKLMMVLDKHVKEEEAKAKKDAKESK